MIASDAIDSQGHKRRVLLFVHGYNVSFDDALDATARLSAEVQFPVIPVASLGHPTAHTPDIGTTRITYATSSKRFMEFLQGFLSKSQPEVDIVCHSMGAREVTSALAELGRHKARLPALHKVIFAAADIWSKEFIDVWPDLQKLDGVEFEFYASNHDLALKLSHIVHRVPRLGDASPVTAPAGGTTVDASALATFQAVGHSYILDVQGSAQAPWACGLTAISVQLAAV